jgi:LuxR family maltose regulon positive regulatory protein
MPFSDLAPYGGVRRDRSSRATVRLDLREVVMAGPLLETKLQVPRRRRDLVARPRLSERLSRGAESELMLVSAPAGFGKTTLLADWLAGPVSSGRAAAWLSLD